MGCEWVDAERVTDARVCRFEPSDGRTRQRFVAGRLEEHREVVGAHLEEAALQLLLLTPEREPFPQLVRARRVLPRGFVDRNRLSQMSRTIVQITEPHGCLQMIRLERKGALEAGPRHVIPPEHERGDAGAEAVACVARLERRSPGERLQRVTESLTLDGRRARARKGDADLPPLELQLRSRTPRASARPARSRIGCDKATARCKTDTRKTPRN